LSVLAARRSGCAWLLNLGPVAASVVCGESMILHVIPGSLVPDV
jgi:hypothetical protein